MSGVPSVPPTLRLDYLRRDVADAVRARRPRRIFRAFASFVFPVRWPSPQPTRSKILQERVQGGSRAAATATQAQLASGPDASRPGTAAAVLRAAALEVVANGLPSAGQRVERAVAAYLRGELGPIRGRPDEGSPGQRAHAAADSLRSAGHVAPVIAATFPGFHPNPYGALMEVAYRPHGMAAIHVTDPGGVDAIIDSGREGDYRTVVHLNAPDRFVGRVASPDEAAAAAAAALRTIDGWIARGATIVFSVHNGPRLIGHRGLAERTVAQGILDRARMIHLLSASTERLLAGWVQIDAARSVHVPHPSYDGVYGPPPPRDEARARYGISTGDPEPLVIGMIGSLANRKGGIELLDALAQAPETVADGRPLRLLIAGTPIGSRAEELIRRALTDSRVIARLGYIGDDEMPSLLAALDVAVIPYGQLLNSGWLHLALTAGIPAIAPADTTAQEIVHPAALRTFRSGDPASLVEALAAAGQLASPAARLAARRSVEALDAQRLSERFVKAVLAAIDGVGARHGSHG